MSNVERKQKQKKGRCFFCDKPYECAEEILGIDDEEVECAEDETHLILEGTQDVIQLWVRKRCSQLQDWMTGKGIDIPRT